MSRDVEVQILDRAFDHLFKKYNVIEQRGGNPPSIVNVGGIFLTATKIHEWGDDFFRSVSRYDADGMTQYNQRLTEIDWMDKAQWPYNHWLWKATWKASRSSKSMGFYGELDLYLEDVPKIHLFV